MLKMPNHFFMPLPPVSAAAAAAAPLILIVARL
jgi:hypothetical protein